LTVTGALIIPERVIDGVSFPKTFFTHQMVLDSVDDFKNEYVLQNSLQKHGGAVVRIPKTREYYASESTMMNNCAAAGEFKYYGPKGEFMWLVNEEFRQDFSHRVMKENTWYLLPQAYSLTLVPY
jgi:hypothetical protein